MIAEVPVEITSEGAQRRAWLIAGVGVALAIGVVTYGLLEGLAWILGVIGGYR